jgi:uracil-DNA glycosylase family 4
MVNGPLCAGCAFEPIGTIFIPFDGAGTNHVLLLGDSAWQHEAAAKRSWNGQQVGTPFAGPSGWFIEKNLKRIGAKRSDFLIANAIWCKAPQLGMTDNPDKYPEAALALEHCRPYLDDLIERMKPRAIVPMGNAALRRVTGLSGIQALQSYILPTPYGIPAIPTFHPSYILKGNQKLAGLWCYAVKRAVDWASGAALMHQVGLLLDPPLAEAEHYLEPLGTVLVCDIETMESDQFDEEEREAASWEVVRIGFSNLTGTAISMPWSEPYISLAKERLARARELVFWNQAFDVPRLRAAGCQVNGRVIDAMWAWHWLQSDLPKGLGFVAPLLLPLEPWKQLGAQEPARYNALDAAITMDCYLEIRRQLEEQGRWQPFVRHCIEMTPILEGMSARGVRVDRLEQAGLAGQLELEARVLFDKIDAQVPVEAKSVKHYKRKDDVVLPFNPASPLQMKRLITTLGLKVPRGKTKSGETTGDKHLQRFARKHPVFHDILEWKERRKLLDTYIWLLDKDDRVHPQFGFWPSTWRKAARNPNIQTIPKRSKLAKEFRKMIVASPGHLLVECDSSGIEAVLVGYFAQSPRYIELAKRGVHKWLAEQYAGRPVSKDEPLYDKIKRIVHLSNYMGTPRRIFEEYPDDFESIKEASELQEFYFGTGAGMDVRRWQQTTLVQAHKEHFLDTPFGQRHYFYQVFTSDNKLGEDAKRAVAFRPQASASAIQDTYALSIRDNHAWMLPYFVAVVHDAFIADVPKDRGGKFARTLRDVMQQPIVELGGLTIGAEAKLGPNLAEMEVVE